MQWNGVAPVGAVAGHFPELPPTPAPLGLVLVPSGLRRCASCGIPRPMTLYRYAPRAAARAAVCAFCRKIDPTSGYRRPHASPEVEQ